MNKKLQNKKGQVFETVVLIFTGMALFTIITALSFKYELFDTGGIGLYAGGLINTYQNQEESFMALDLIMSQTSSNALIDLSATGGLLKPNCGKGTYYLWNNAQKECFPDYKQNLVTKLEQLFNETIVSHQSFLLGKNFNFQVQQNIKTEFIAISAQKITTSIEVSKSLSKNCETSIMGKSSIDYDEALDYLQTNYPKSPFVQKPELIQLILDESKKLGVDAVFIFGMYKQETIMGTSGIASRTNNPGNVRLPISCSFDTPFKNNCQQAYGGKNCPIPGNCMCSFADCNPTSGCFCGFTDWETGIMSNFNILERGYISQGITTLESIIAKYAPNTDKYGGNDESKYVMNLKEFASNYRDIPCKVQLGEYTYRPGSVVKKDYNISWYDKLINFSNKTINKCNDNTSACLIEEIINFNQTQKENLAFFRQCEEGETRVFFEFIENLNDCAQTKDDKCICKLNEHNTTPSRQLLNITMDKQSNGLKYYNISLIDENINTYFKIDEDVWMPSEYRYIHTNKGLYEGREIVFIDLVNKEHRIDDFENLYLVKNLTNNFIVVEKNGKMYNAINKEITVPTKICNAPRVTYNFCLQTNKTMLLITNETIKEKDTNIKFGLTLIDRMPPKLISVSAEDFKSKGNSILLKWTLPKYPTGDIPKDVVEYRIYCSDQQITDLYELNETYVAIVTDKTIQSFNLELNKCEKQPIIDGTTYYLAVTPVDVANQEHMEPNFVQAKSISDTEQAPQNVGMGLVVI